MNVRRRRGDSDDEETPMLYFGSVSSDSGAFPLTEIEKKRWRKEVREREQKRIEPGFYVGERPKYSEG